MRERSKRYIPPTPSLPVTDAGFIDDRLQKNVKGGLFRDNLGL
jgi:hypothetical protein